MKNRIAISANCIQATCLLQENLPFKDWTLIVMSTHRTNVLTSPHVITDAASICKEGYTAEAMSTTYPTHMKLKD